MAANKSLAGDFTSGSIVKKLIAFMIPILGALILQAMYGAVDLLVVGHFGTDAGISGVSTGSSVINLVTFIVGAMTMGLTVMISRYLGEQRQDRISRVIGAAVFFFLIFTAVMMILLICFTSVWASLLNAPEEAFDLTCLYIRICGVGLVFVVAFNVISGIFRGLGNSQLPLIFVGIACVVNIFGDLFFIAVLHMNVAGAALATIIAQAVSVILSIVIIRRQELPFTFSLRDIGINHEMRGFISLGAPLALQEALTNISFLILFAIVNKIGLEASSGYGIAQKVVSFVMLIPSSLMQSMAAFVGQNVGAGKEKRARQAMFTGMAMGMAIGVFITLFAWFRGDLLAEIFSENMDFVVCAHDYLRGFSSEAILTCVVFSYIGFFNGHGMSLPVMLQGITASFLVRVPMSYLFSLKEGATLFDIGLAVPLASVYGIIFFSVWYLVYIRKSKGPVTE